VHHPDHRDGARVAGRAITRDERQAHRLRGGHDERVERVARERRKVRQVHLIGGDIERLVRGVAEQIAEELPDAAPQVDAPCPTQKTALPHHRGRT
jgi:hypothetical protein